MADVDKIICCDRNDDGLMTSLLASGGMNNQWNNPFVYLVWMMMANRLGYGNNDQNNVAIEALRNQMQDNQNSSLLMDAVKGVNVDIRSLANELNCDFNTLNAAICDVRGGIDKCSGLVGLTGERVINSVERGQCEIIGVLKDCCCATQKEILNQTNLLQRGQDFINRSIERGFSAQGFQAQQDKCDIIRAGEANTQRIVDLLNGHWSSEKDLQIQDLKFQLSQKEQNEYLLKRLSGCGCGCNNNGCF